VVEIFEGDFEGFAEVEGHGEFVFGEGDHNIDEVAECCVEGVGIEVLFPEEEEPDGEGYFMISGGDVDLFIETPVIFHELFAMI
jgi:hypothetical protein